MPSRKIPNYRHHKACNLAVVTIDGKDVYLGEYNSPESKAKYERLISERHRRHHETSVAGARISVCELMAAYFAFAVDYYVKHDKPTREFGCIAEALRRVRVLNETTEVDEDVERALVHLTPVLADMIRLQRLSGGRPGEMVRLRPMDIDRRKDV